MYTNNVTDRSVSSQQNPDRVSGEFAERTKSDPCPHCGKPDWCYQIGELSACKRGAEPATGWVKTNQQDKEGTYYYAPQRTEKAIRPKQKKEFIYRDRTNQPLVKVTRSDDGEGNRRFYQSYWDGLNWKTGKKTGKGMTPEEKAEYQILKDKIKTKIPIYRYQEVRDAIAQGKPIFLVEGEGIADTLWELGIAATTTIGGSGKYHLYGSYKADLEGAELVLCPDRDEPGLKHMEEIFTDFPNAKWLYAPPNDFYWSHLPESGGVDIADWVRDGATASMILEAIEDRRVVVDKLNQDFNASDSDGARQARSKNKQLLNFLKAQWGDRLKFNEMTLDPELDGKPMDLDCLSVRLADEFDLDVGKEKACENIIYIAKHASYHPVREYLYQLGAEYPDTLENRQLFESIATRYFGTSEPLYDAFMSKTMIGAVQRVFDPGCQHDTICTLQGKQGLRKSTFLSKLAVNRSWFDDSLNSSNSTDKDERLKLRSAWILELAEIEAMFKRKEVSAFRGFVTTKTDKYRVPYGRKTEDFPRTSIFVGSVNPDEFLVDPEGHRRYWIIPVQCDRIPVEQLEKERDILWAMAVHAYHRGETNYLNHEQEKRNALLNKRYEVTDSWQEIIEFWIEHQSEVTISGVLSDCLRIEISRHDRSHQMRVAQILKSLGWSKQEKKKIEGRTLQVWRRWQPENGGSQPGGNQVATKVATDSNPYISMDTEKRLLPLDENSPKNISTENSLLNTTENYPSKTLDIGSNPKVVTLPESSIQQEIEPVATPVATFAQNSIPGFEIEQAKQSVLACRSKTEIKQVTANWDEPFRQQVRSRLTESERQYLGSLPDSCGNSADENRPFKVGDRVASNDPESDSFNWKGTITRMHPTNSEVCYVDYPERKSLLKYRETEISTRLESLRHI